MIFFELDAAEISNLNDGDLRELVARLCQAELIQQAIQPSSVTGGGAQEAADGELDVRVKDAGVISNPNFVPRGNTGFQVKKHSMGKAACKKEMEKNEELKATIKDLPCAGARNHIPGPDDRTRRIRAYHGVFAIKERRRLCPPARVQRDRILVVDR